MRVLLLDETVSTNDEARRLLPGGEDAFVCAVRQTGGRGTKDRSFSSEEGGVYLSALTFHQGLPAADAFKLMAHAAVSVCRTAERFGISPAVKWCNDVLAGGKKLSGILIENILSAGEVRASIVGIGLNVSNPLRGLEDIAVSMKDLLPVPPAVEEVREALMDNYCRPSDFSDYLHYVGFLGRTVCVREGEAQYRATALSVLPDGRLLIERGGVRRALSAAEISITL